MNQLEKFKLVQKKFEPEVNLNHNICIISISIFYSSRKPIIFLSASQFYREDSSSSHNRNNVSL